MHAIKTRSSLLVPRLRKKPNNFLPPRSRLRCKQTTGPGWPFLDAQRCQNPEITVRKTNEGWTWHVSDLSFFWSGKAARLLRMWLTTQLRFAAALTDGSELRHKSIRAWAHAGRTVKETVPHGRDVTQQQLTVTTQRPNDGDARLFSVNFCSEKSTRAYQLMGFKPSWHSRGPLCQAASLIYNFMVFAGKNEILFPVLLFSSFPLTPSNHKKIEQINTLGKCAVTLCLNDFHLNNWINIQGASQGEVCVVY